ncbi:ATP-binding protein [Butyrivibrio sp. MC2013]|uniref:ATP-binding protein n=1 Tax=Butyrivibrio sp. MC2013 TaxID=1280686 RepID=UPI00041EC091|nr:ATP-binding protein [Butyrivibrio sp. MC2013]
MALSNSQYDQIMHEYEIRQFNSRRENDKRREYVYAHIPGYKELEDAVSTISVEFEIERLRGADRGKEVLRKKLASNAAARRSLLEEAGLPSDYLMPVYECPDCKDTGYIGNEKCHCFQQKMISLLYEKSNLELLTQQNNFSLLSEGYYGGEDLKHFQAAEKISQSFIKNFGEDYQNLFFYGTVGVGKSFLSICIAKELLDRGISVVYYSAADLFRQLSDLAFDYNSKAAMESLSECLFNCELLIIDDLGTELESRFVNSQLFTILNERDLRRRASIISTNLSLSDIQNRYQDRIFSRLVSHFQLLRLSGQDIRLQKART